MRTRVPVFMKPWTLLAGLQKERCQALRTRAPFSKVDPHAFERLLEPRMLRNESHAQLPQEGSDVDAHGIDGQCQVAEHNDNATPHDRFALPQEPIGHPSAWQTHQVDCCGVQALDDARDDRGFASAAVRNLCRNVKCQDGAHSVVREAFPHFGEDTASSGPGVSEKAVGLRRFESSRRRGKSHVHRSLSRLHP
jgi:hypothetical protein